MEGNHQGFPKMNAIFRNQPHWSYFNKSLEDDQDHVFLALNEIDSYFMQPEQKADKRGFETFVLKDPRNQHRVTQYIYDHSEEITPALFCSPKWSSLLKVQHQLGLRILKARQEASEIAEEDYLDWKKSEATHSKEAKEFHNFVFEFCETNKEQIYNPTRLLGNQYKKWYARKAKVLLSKYPDETYNTHLGLPHVRVCKEVLKKQCADIADVDVVAEKGRRLSWASKEPLQFKQFSSRLEAYVEDYMNSEDLQETLEEDMKIEFLKLMEHEDLEIPNYFIPLESLLFLLMAGDYCDVATEMLVEIKEHEAAENNEEKIIIADKPLPSCQMGWHAYKQIVEQASVTMLSLPTNEEEENVPEFKSYPQPELTNFPVKSFEDFMSTCTMTPDKKCKFSTTLTKWQLKASGKDMIKHIYTTSNTVPQFLGPYSLKMEYKPAFGCELTTKYELLHEWFRLKLQKAAGTTCYRLDVNNYATLLVERQDLPKLEEQLKTIYHISMPQLLSNLYEFLTLLTSMPSGHYMLRYNPKFKDKLMLCKPSQEITQSTVRLHQLLQREPSELIFMAGPNYLPIANDLCSRLHDVHQILPCAFKPSNYLKKRSGNAKEEKPFKLLNDKDWILEKMKNKKRLADKKRCQRARKTKRRAKKKAHGHKANANEEEKTQCDMEADQFILGV